MARQEVRRHRHQDDRQEGAAGPVPHDTSAASRLLHHHGPAGGPRGPVRGDAQQVRQDVPDVVPLLAAGAERQLPVRAVRCQGGVRRHQLAGLGQHPLLDQAPADRAEPGQASARLKRKDARHQVL